MRKEGIKTDEIKLTQNDRNGKDEAWFEDRNVKIEREKICDFESQE